MKEIGWSPERSVPKDALPVSRGMLNKLVPAGTIRTLLIAMILS